ncbi:MAG TPA: hypothetical protein VN783_03440, partial [Thermoanaerobaculia bacterium]|nr:hypothetical protein [Thermoanaerobaculia bacterium]
MPVSLDFPASPDAPDIESAPGRLVSEDGLAWLVLDDPGKKVNVLSARFVRWFGEQLEALEAAPPAGLILISGKPDSFVAGADLTELAALEN